MNLRQAFLNFILIVAGACLLLWTPLHNGYPLIYSDSGTYIFSGALSYVPSDRPIGYGLFIRYLNPIPSLWGVVLLQALATSFLTFRVAAIVLPFTRWRSGIAFGIVALTALTTTVSTFVGFISPDIFSAWLVLASCLLVLGRTLSDRVMAILVIFWALQVHTTHIALAIALLALLGAGYLFLPRTRAQLKRPALLLGGLVVTAIAILSGLNFLAFGEWTLAPVGATILLNRFVTSGIAAKTLETYCGQEDWKLCEYRALLRAPHAAKDWFLWGADSPANIVGWDKNVPEQRAILAHAVQCCWGEIVAESAREAWAQFWMARSGDHIAYLAKEFNAARAIRRVYPRERAQFLNSIEQAGKPVPISLMPLSEQVMLGIFLGAAVILFGVSIARKEYNLAALLGVTLILLTANAIFVGALNGAAGRYQMRLAWLLAYCTYLYAAVFIARRRQRACSVSNLLSVC